MIEKLISIPGPIFLIIYTVYSVIVIYLIKVFVSRDSSLKFEIPDPTKLTPLDVGLLKNGLKGAIITSVFSLWRQKAIDISSNKNRVILKRKEAEILEFNKLESTLYQYLSKPKYYKMLFKRSSLKAIDKVLQPNKEKLLELKLAPDNSVINKHWLGAFFGFVLLTVFGGIKIYYGIVREKPVIFLVILFILSIIILRQLIRPNKVKTSALGKKFISTAKTRFEWLKSSEKGKTLLKSEDLLYGIAIFGISSFAGSSLGSLLTNPILIDQSSNSLYGNGCAGCGGNVHGCGGGGCSGGCSGGGCGGCGGCGG